MLRSQSEITDTLHKKLAKDIYEAFQKIDPTITMDQISKGIGSIEKLGVTNFFFTITADATNYLVRINGKQWWDYTRSDEEMALKKAKELGIETNVLVNANEFQICIKPPDSLQLASIVKNGTEEEIKQALKLVALEIAKLCQITEGIRIVYPIEGMINVALNGAKKRLETNIQSTLLAIQEAKQKQEELLSQEASIEVVSDSIKNFEIELKKNQEAFKYLISHAEACDKMLMIFKNTYQNKIFGHNDLLLKSIFVDIAQSKVMIVDWEYASWTYPNNDLGIMCQFLNKEQTKYLLEQYTAASKLGQVTPEQLLIVQFASFLQKFLDIAWKIKPNNPENLSYYLSKMEELDAELEEFIFELNQLYEGKNKADKKDDNNEEGFKDTGEKKDKDSSKDFDKDEKEDKSEFKDKDSKSDQSTNADNIIITAHDKHTSPTYKPLFKSTIHSQKAWVQSPIREILYEILDNKMQSLIQQNNITVALPTQKYQGKSSPQMGWHLFFDQEKNEYLAILRIPDLADVNKLEQLINNNSTHLKAKPGKVDNGNCIIISFSPNIALSGELDKIAKPQATQHHGLKK